MTTRRLFIEITGGGISRFFSPDDLGDLEITTLDLDTDGIERKRLKIRANGEGCPEEVYVVEGHDIEVDAADVLLDANLPEFDDLFADG